MGCEALYHCAVYWCLHLVSEHVLVLALGEPGTFAYFGLPTFLWETFMNMKVSNLVEMLYGFNRTMSIYTIEITLYLLFLEQLLRVDNT